MTKEEFTKDSQGYGSHRPLLWEALEATKNLKRPVLELGAGESSTPYLRQYCKDNDLKFRSYDSDHAWAKKMGVYYNDGNWDKLNCWDIHWGVVLLDLAPGEYRRVALMNLNAEVIVLHDSEPVGWNASDYRVRPLFSKFKYMIDDIPKEKGAPWTTALSNTIDVTQFKL